MRTEVRCCCEAGKLLGTIPEVPRIGMSRVFTFATEAGVESFTLDWGRIDIPGIVSTRGDERYALKSMDLPIEKLRQIEGWIDHE